MRIAIVSQSDNPWTAPYARGFLAAGHAVRVFSYNADPIEGIEVVALRGKRPAWIPREIWFAMVLPRLQSALRKFAPDVVFSPYVSSNGVTTALVWKGPRVVSARGSDVNPGADGRYPTWPWLHRRLVRLACNGAKGLHAVSEELAERVAACGVDRTRIECFPLGVDLRRFPPAGEASGGGAPGIVCTRRQEAIYANHVIVAALGRLAKEGAAFRAVMVGGGPLLESRREQARRLGVASIEFTGQIARDRLGEILRASRIYVSASLSDGTSSSLLEALATGLFPVVSRIRGNLDWIRDGETGLLFDPGDEEGLARALRRALGDEDLRARAAKENRELVEREGSLDRNMERMLSLLDRAARARSR